jgi:hypothetical protein
MEWVTGVKLTTLPAPEIKELAKQGQEAFLTQLLEIGATLRCASTRLQNEGLHAIALCNRTVSSSFVFLRLHDGRH